ncbi:MAG: phage portal protein family protein, partial [bacterium]
NPDYIDVQASIMAEEPMIELIPDSQITAIVNGGPNGEWGEMYKQLPDDVIRQVKMGQNIRLDNRLVSHIAHKASQYETWGTPIMMRCFKTLIYKDKLRQAQDSIANRHIMPIRVAKIGQPGEPMPSQEDLDSFRDTLMQADADPNFFIVYHYGLNFEYVGSNGKILPLQQEFDFIQKELMNALGINQAMLNGEGPTYANAQVGFDTLARRYMSYRLRLESWIRNKVYRPIAEIQGFYKSKNGEIESKWMSPKQRRISAARKDMELIVPDIAWQQQDLTSNQGILNFVQQLSQRGLISMSTVLPMLNLDPETEKENLERERGTVFDPNAPKEGPLPNSGGPLGTTPGGAPSKPGGSPGKSDSDSEPSKPSSPPPGPPSKETSKNVKDFFVEGGKEQAKRPSRVIKIKKIKEKQ